ncbi:MAG: hypothetical protein NT069_04465 [Planctomycetota bacterium]|nr:hypothetical protein [Planctomycetota bacterium]
MSFTTGGDGNHRDLAEQRIGVRKNILPQPAVVDRELSRKHRATVKRRKYGRSNDLHGSVWEWTDSFSADTVTEGADLAALLAT